MKKQRQLLSDEECQTIIRNSVTAGQQSDADLIAVIRAVEGMREEALILETLLSGKAIMYRKNGKIMCRRSKQ